MPDISWGQVKMLLTIPPARKKIAANPSRMRVTVGFMLAQNRAKRPMMLAMIPNPPAHAVKPVVLPFA